MFYINYKNKFKNRSPQKTIQIIKKFFNNNNLKVEEKQIIKSISGTWSVHLVLLLNNKPINASNGKGVTKNYALASGYAELYERFCNKLYDYYNNQLSLIIEYLSYEKNNYFLHPKEKVLTFNEGLMESKKLYQILSKTNTIDMMEIIFQNQWIGVPFYNLLNNEPKYLDPRLLAILESSTGMSAGNSKKEAIIQGLSEQFEHQIKWNFIDLIKKQPLYEINVNKINNPTLQNIIAKIKKENDFFLFDASYYYNTPVLFGIIINKNFNTVTLNISSFPVFDIAVERICTELYQGIFSYENKDKTLISSRQKEKYKKDYFWSENTTDFYNIQSIPEEVFLKEHILCDTPNLNIFLTEKNYSENYIYSYYLNLIKKNKYNVYYYDCSLDKNMYALKIYVEEIINMSDIYLFPLEEKVKKSILLNNEIFNNCIFSKTIDLKLIEELNLNYNNFTDFEKSCFLRFSKRSLAFEIFDTYSNDNYFTLLDSILSNNLYLSNNNIFSLFKKSYANWKIKLSYLNDNNYTQEEIQKILSYFNLQLSEQDIRLYKDKKYLLNEIIFKNIYDLYYNEDYKKYIELLISLTPVN